LTFLPSPCCQTLRFAFLPSISLPCRLILADSHFFPPEFIPRKGVLSLHTFENLSPLFLACSPTCPHFLKFFSEVCSSRNLRSWYALPSRPYRFCNTPLFQVPRFLLRTFSLILFLFPTFAMTAPPNFFLLSPLPMVVPPSGWEFSLGRTLSSAGTGSSYVHFPYRLGSPLFSPPTFPP